MKLRLEILVLILLFLLVVVPMAISSTILEENNITQNNTTLLNVPDVREPANYTSGPTSLQAVLAYYGTDATLSQLVNQTNTTENGTLPENIAQAARDHGFTAELKENMTLKDLQDNINQGTPTIVLVQAGGNNNTGNWTNTTGENRYMVVVGMDDQNMYLEDPAILGSRGYIPLQEFMDRWHAEFINTITGNNTMNNTTAENNTTVVNATTFSHLGIIITGGSPATFPPFIKID